MKRRDSKYLGHVEATPYFWGDLAREHIQYVRNFCFPDVNTIRQDPYMPYHDPRRPFVNYWFSSSDGHDVDAFCTLLSPENQDRLERERGACIVYTHFASGFFRDGQLDRRFVQLMRRLAERNGWFVPASELLDYLRAQRRSDGDLRRPMARVLQRRWASAKFSRGSS